MSVGLKNLNIQLRLGEKHMKIDDSSASRSIRRRRRRRGEGEEEKMNKKKIFKLAKGFRGRAKNCIRIARERVEKALQYSYRDRRNKKRDMRSLWIERINAGTRQHGVICTFSLPVVFLVIEFLSLFHLWNYAEFKLGCAVLVSLLPGSFHRGSGP
ncbi:hypothetical protein Cgig2_028242 [Carnegiea gigantea]|uniref:Large ribosomal subunit protein bL20c n=1 Tax=Carnegiea gigantea TaxID=171969 RepID=A0A9Q1KHL4_9CARY|nr:hypothetical protein Cgig2_028242 [Carnegiea gigantea]